jgi:hypothetical protein
MARMGFRFESTYPSVARWVKTISGIEIGYDDMRPSFVRALDIGGMIGEGGDGEEPIDTTLKTLDQVLERWTEENLGG